MYIAMRSFTHYLYEKCLVMIRVGHDFDLNHLRLNDFHFDLNHLHLNDFILI